jgi:hypothetical protein
MSPVHLRPHIETSDIEAWLAGAVAGVLEYHRGFLAVDRIEIRRAGEKERRRLGAAADLALRLASEKRVHLVQHRHGAGDYSYFMVATRRGAR